MSAVCIKRTPCDPFRLEDKVCSVCQMVHDETQRDKINYRAWATNMIDFLRFKGIEHEFTDWCGGWQYPGKALEGTSDPAQPSPAQLVLAEMFSHSAINEAMQDAWNDICSDTGCHPLDIEQGRSKQLTFSPNHWANQIAKRLFLRAVKVQLKADAEASALPSTDLGCGDPNCRDPNCTYGKGPNRDPLSSPDRWPVGCHDPDSCARHKACMYVKCRHGGRSIAGEVEAAMISRPHREAP